MLYNAMDNTKYDVSIIYLLDCLSSEYRRSDIVKDFISRWKTSLLYAYQTNKYKVLNKSVEQEFFSKYVYIGGQKIYFQFNIFVAKYITKKMIASTENINSLPYHLIEFEYYKNNLSYSNSTEPIIIVDFPITRDNGKLVIDGNHRLSSKYDAKTCFHYKYLPYQYAYHIIVNTFESALYLFFCELNIVKKFKTSSETSEFLYKYSLYKLFSRSSDYSPHI